MANIQSPAPSNNPNTGKNLPGAPGALIKHGFKNSHDKTHDGTGATYANNSKLAEATYSALQTLMDCGFGLVNFMIGQGRAGIPVRTDFGTFNFGARFNVPLGYIGGHVNTGVNFNAGFISSPGVTISPPNIVSNVTSTGPSGGVNH